MKRLLLILALLCAPALALAQATGPYGVFGGPIPSASLPPATKVPTNTFAFTTDLGLLQDNGSAWVAVSGGASGSVSGVLPGQVAVGATATVSATGSITGTALTVSGVTSTIAIGQYVIGTGVTTGTIITAGSGTSWTVNTSQTVGSESMTFSTGSVVSGVTTVPAGITYTSPVVTQGIGLNDNIAFSGTQTSIYSWLFTPSSATLSGAVTNASSGRPPALANLYVLSDTADASANGLNGLSIIDRPATGYKGGRNGIFSEVFTTGSAATTGSAGPMVGGSFLSNMGTTQGGSSGWGNGVGAVYGTNPQFIINGTYATLGTGEEIDAEVLSGASVQEKYGLTIVQSASDAVQGTYDDAALEFNSQGGSAVPWHYGISFCGYSQLCPFNSTSTLIGIQARQQPSVTAPTVGSVLDASAATITNYFLKSNGFTVDGSGNAAANSLTLPGAQAFTLAKTAAQVYPSPSPADRSVIAATQSWENGSVQEPNVWYYNGYYNMIYTGGWSGTSLGYAYATNPKGPWTHLSTPVIGNGYGGTSAGQYVSHTGLYIEGTTVYVTSSIAATGSLILWSAPIGFTPSTGPVFTKVGNIMALPSGTTAWGNSQLIAITPGSSYALLTEALQTSSGNYQTGLSTATGALTTPPTFTTTTWPLTQLNSILSNYYGGVSSASASGPWTPDAIGVHQTGSNLITLYYHASGTSLGLPTEIFRATSPVNDLVNWTSLDNGYPAYRRQLPQEVDQAADPSPVVGPGGDWWMFSSALNNLAQVASIVATPAFSTQTVSSNGNTVPIERTTETYNSNEIQFNALKTTATSITAIDHDNINVNGTSASTVTLPRATQGAVVKVNVWGPATTSITIAATGSDSLTCTTMVSPMSVTFYGAAGYWSTSGCGVSNNLTAYGLASFGGPSTGAAESVQIKNSNSQFGLWNTGAGANGGRYGLASSATTLTLRTLNDAGGTTDNILNVTRSSSAPTITAIAYGNATDNPAETMYGTLSLPGLAASSAATTGTVCWTTSSGLLTVDTTTTCLLSDGRMKTGIEPLDAGLSEIMALKPVSYDLKPEVNPEHLGRQVGLVAQDVIKVDPRLAAVYQTGPNKGTPSSVRYEQMVALLVKGMQEQQHEIVALKAGEAKLVKANASLTRRLEVLAPMQAALH